MTMWARLEGERTLEVVPFVKVMVGCCLFWFELKVSLGFR